MKICCISDTHGQEKVITNKLPIADVLIYGGDFSGAGYLHEAQNFADWLNEIKYYYQYIVVCGGNHDWSLVKQPNAAKKYITDTGAIYLENEEVVIDGTKFWGSPATREFCNWAFNYTEEQLIDIWATIPEDVNILITHSMPKDILDFTPHGNIHVGEVGLVERIKELKQLKLYVGGHLHNDHGILVENNVTYVNACICDERYKPLRTPILVEIDDITKEVKVLPID